MLPALVGIAVKLWLLVVVHRSNWVSKPLLAFVSVFAVQNFSELLLFSSFSSNVGAEYLIRIYYVCTSCVVAYGFHYIVSGRDSILAKFSLILVGGYGAIVCCMIMFSNLLITGAEHISYSITAAKGAYYWVFQAYIFSSMLAWLIGLAINYSESKGVDEKIRNYFALLALTPVAVASIAIVILMKLNIQVNATLIIPIVSTLFLMILNVGRATTEFKRDPRQKIPFSLESRMYSRLAETTAQYGMENIGHKEFMADVERIALEYKLLSNDKNVVKTAQSINIERSTLYAQFRALKMSHREL